MYKNQISILLIISFLVSGCSTSFSAANPTPNIEETISSMAIEMISGTLTAGPTSTKTATNTTIPTSTNIPTQTITITSIPTETETLTPEAFRGEFSLGDQSGEDDGLLRIENQSGQPFIIITLSGNTWKKQLPIYYSWEVSGFLLQMIKFGKYTITVEIPGKTTIFGNFQQNNTDKTTIIVTKNSIKVIGP